MQNDVGYMPRHGPISNGGEDDGAAQISQVIAQCKYDAGKAFQFSLSYANPLGGGGCAASIGLSLRGNRDAQA